MFGSLLKHKSLYLLISALTVPNTLGATNTPAPQSPKHAPALMPINTVRLLPQAHYVEGLEVKTEYFNFVLRSQLAIASHLLGMKNPVVFAEGLTEPLTEKMFKDDPKLRAARDDVQKLFKDAVFTEAGLSAAQKEMLVSNDAVTVLFYLGKVKEVLPLLTPGEVSLSNRILEAIDRKFGSLEEGLLRSPEVRFIAFDARESAASRALQRYFEANPGTAVCLTFGAGHTSLPLVLEKIGIQVEGKMSIEDAPRYQIDFLKKVHALLEEDKKLSREERAKKAESFIIHELFGLKKTQ